MPRLLSALLCSAISTGCASVAPRPAPPPVVVPEIRLERVRLPPSLLSCHAEPPPPAGAAVPTGEFLQWVEDLRHVADDCAAKLACVRALDAGEECAPGAVKAGAAP